jgi:hypothetical protein
MLEPGTAFCGECGAPAGQHAPEEGSDVIVYPDLARANLHRLRGDVGEAEKICLSILKRFPNNPGAHVLLGDLHADAGRLDQARQWFEIATDLMPENRALAGKLNRVRDEIAREADRAATSGLEVSEPNRNALTAIGAVVALLLIVGFLAYLLGGARANAARDKRVDVIEPISINGTAPAVPNGTSKTAPRDDAQNPDVTPSEKPPVSTDSGASREDSMTQGERSLFAAISQDIGNLTLRTLHISVDTQAGIAIATVSGAAGAALSQDGIDAAVIGAAIIRRGTTLQRAKVRIVEGKTGRIRFSGAVTASSLSAASGELNSFDWARSILVDQTPAL